MQNIEGKSTSDRRTASTQAGQRAALADVDSRIPVRLLTGRPGSGKTSVIRHLAANPGGRRRAHVVSDPDTLDRLPGAVRRWDERTAVLENGAVYFLMRDCDVVEALSCLQLRKMGLIKGNVDFDEVLVEIPCDFAPLVVIYQLQTDSRLALTYRFEAIAEVVDAAAVRQALGRDLSDAPGIARADMLIVNKQDTLSQADFEAVLDEVASVNPFASIVAARHGAVDADFLMGSNPFAPRHALREADNNPARCTLDLPPVGIDGPAKDAISCLVNNPMNNPRSNAPGASTPVRAAHVVLKGPADIFRTTGVVAKIAEQAGKELYRLKCVVAVPTADHPVLFQYVDGAFIPPAWGEPEDSRETRLTAVGRGLEPRELLADVAACLWDPEAIARGQYGPF